MESLSERQMQALRAMRRDARMHPIDPEVADQERAARAQIAFLDLENFTPADWARLNQAHAMVNAARATARRSRNYGGLAAAWRAVGSTAASLPRIG